MNILFISKHKHPHIGGVEKHVKAISDRLKVLGHKITTISEEDIRPPHFKFIGLLYIWFWLYKNKKLIINTDIIHIHDVFIWYLPFRLFFLKKKVYITFHGWEGKYPIPLWNIVNKKIANKLCIGSFAVGKYVEKYYRIKTNKIIYGGVNKINKTKFKKIKNTLLYLGRQDLDTGINEFKKWLLKQKVKYSVKYITNKPNTDMYLQTAEYCVPSGYLSYLEAKNMNCKNLTFAHNPLKVNYWKEIKLLNRIPTWDNVCNEYLKLWSIH